MVDAIYIRSGALGDRDEMPSLRYDSKFGSEIAFQTEEKALYIGTNKGNVRLCGAGDVGELSAEIKKIEQAIKVLEAKPDYYTKEDIDGLIAGITARLDALENQSE